MNQEFSANRQASRYSGMPCRLEQTSRTASMLPIETGCPPPELLVTVSITIGMRWRRLRLEDEALERGHIHVAFEIEPGLRVGGFGHEAGPPRARR